MAIDQSAIQAISDEMWHAIDDGNWTKAKFKDLLARATEIAPDDADRFTFLLTMAKPGWLGQLLAGNRGLADGYSASGAGNVV